VGNAVKNDCGQRRRTEKLYPVVRFVPAHEEACRSAHGALAAVITDRFTSSVGAAALGMLYADAAGLERRVDPDARLAYEKNLEAGRASGLDVRIESGSYVRGPLDGLRWTCITVVGRGSPPG
jgi:hypothetical protein